METSQNEINERLVNLVENLVNKVSDMYDRVNEIDHDVNTLTERVSSLEESDRFRKLRVILDAVEQDKDMA